MQYFKKLERDRRSTTIPQAKVQGNKEKELNRGGLVWFFPQNKNATLKTEETTEKRKDLWQTFQEKHLDLKESHKWHISDERAKLQDHQLCEEQKSTMKPAGFSSTAHTEQHDGVLCDHLPFNTSPLQFFGFVFCLFAIF